MTALIAFSTPLVGVAGIFNLAVPMAIGLAASRLPDGLNSLRRSFVVTAAIAATYGVVQYVSPFAWDVRWVKDTQFLSTGRVGTPEFRPFATLPAPGTMAVVAAVVVLLVVLPGSPVGVAMRAWAASSCGLILLLTQVRSVWIATVAAVIVAAAGERRRMGRTVAAVAGLAFVLILFVPGKTTIVDRVKTLSNPGADTSYSSRTELLRTSASLISPIGRGIGQYSAGNRVVGGRSTDNGYLVVLAETGVVGFALLLWVLGAAVHNASTRDYPYFAFLIVVNSAGFAIGGVGAILLWATCGLQSAKNYNAPDANRRPAGLARDQLPKRREGPKQDERQSDSGDELSSEARQSSARICASTDLGSLL